MVGPVASEPLDDPNVILVVVNLDHGVTPRRAGSTSTSAPLGLDPDRPFVVHDLLTDARYPWQGSRNFVMLDPGRRPRPHLRRPPARRSRHRHRRWSP